MENNADVKIKWKSRAEFYASLVGYSIGMPEFWRVPYLAYRNGGGTFIAVYAILMLVCGLPLYFIELALAQYSGKGPWRIWDICPLLRGMGIGIAIVNVICSVNYAILVVWVFEYLVNSFNSVLPWTTCDNSWNTKRCYIQQGTTVSNATATYNVTSTQVKESYNVTSIPYHLVEAVDEFWLYRILNVSSGISMIGTISGMYALYLFLLRVFAAFSIVKSVETLGKLMMVTALLPIILVFIMWMRAISLDGAVKGMLLFLTPQWDKLVDSQLWMEASFQTFLTLGPGWGGLFMLSCHNTFHTNILRASLVSVISTLLFGIMNGLLVFSVLGVMSTELGVPIDSVLTSGGFSIAFIAYPKALSYFPFPQAWCVLFYVVLLLPGFDALTIFTEPYLIVLEEIFPRKLFTRRYILLIITSVITFLLGLPYVSQAGVYIFLLIDWYAGTWSITLVCLAECIAFSWIYGNHRINRDVRLMIGRDLPALIRISSAFIMPVFLLILLIVSIHSYKPPSFGKYEFPGYARAIGWCVALSSVVPSVIYSVWIISRTRGSTKEKIKEVLLKNKSWGPVDEKAAAIYEDSEMKADKTFKQLFLFNLFGIGALEVIPDAQEITSCENQKPLLETENGQII